MPEPKRYLENAHDEADLFKVLYNHKLIHLPEPKKVKLEQNVFKSINEKVSIDLYVHFQNNTIIYEGKKDKTTIKDVYQLKMYWDGCVIDEITPTKGILISVYHPESVKDLIEIVNELIDPDGNKYMFELKTWNEEGVDYPN